MYDSHWYKQPSINEKKHPLKTSRNRARSETQKQDRTLVCSQETHRANAKAIKEETNRLDRSKAEDKEFSVLGYEVVKLPSPLLRST